MLLPSRAKAEPERVGESRERLKHPREVSRGEKMLYSGTDPGSYITKHTLVYEDKMFRPPHTPLNPVPEILRTTRLPPTKRQPTFTAGPNRPKF